MSNLIPAQIRLDQNQLNQLINSNLQINLSQLQQSQRENVLQNKNINVTRGLVQITQNQIKTDSSSKTQEGKEGREQKVTGTTVNGNNERLNNSLTGKSNVNLTEVGKQGI